MGYSAPILSYWGAIQFFVNARELLQEGYSKVCYVYATMLGHVLRCCLTQYRGSVFRVPMLDRWVVVFSGAAMNEQLRKYPDDQMNFMDAADEVLPSSVSRKMLLKANLHYAARAGEVHDREGDP